MAQRIPALLTIATLLTQPYTAIRLFNNKRYALAMLLAAAFTVLQPRLLQAQGCNNGSLFPSTAITASTTTGTVAISGCNYATEYARITNIVAGRTYTITSSIGTDFITVRRGVSNGTIVKFGNQPLQFTAPTNEDIFVHFNVNPQCGTNTTCRSTAISTDCNVSGPSTLGYEIGLESTPSFTAASGCSNGTMSIGPGAYYQFTVTANTWYNWTAPASFPATVDAIRINPQNGSGSTVTLSAGGTSTAWFSGSTTIVRASTNRTNCIWLGTGTSSVLTYRHTAPTSVTASASPTAICHGGTVSLTGGGTYVNQWSWTGGPSGGTYSPGSTSQSPTWSSSTTASGAFTLTASNNGCAATGVSTATVSVVADPSVTTNPTSPADICVGGTTANMSIASAGGTPGRSFQWQYSPDGSSGWGAVANGTPAGSSYTNATSETGFNVAGITNPGTYYYRCFVSASGSGCGTAVSGNAVVNVVADPSVTTHPTSPAEICVGGTTANMGIASAGGTPGRTFQWQYSPDGSSGWNAVANNTPAGSVYTNATSETGFNVAGITTAGTYYYRCLVSASGNGCGSVASNNAVVSVVADPSVTTHPTSPAEICVGGTTANMSIVSAGGTPSRTFQWQYSPNGTSGWGAVANGTPAGSSYTNATSETNFNVAGITTAGTYYYRCLVSSSGNGCGTAASNNAVVSVVADPSVTTHPTSPAAICVGGTTANMGIVSAGGTPSRTFQWQYSPDGSSGWGAVANGTPTGSTYTNATSETGFNVAGITNAGTYYYRCFVSAAGNGCGTAVSNNAVVSVADDPLITTSPVSTTICRGGTHTFNSAASGGTPSLNFQWQYFNSGTWENVNNGTPTGITYTDANTPNLGVTTNAINTSAGSYQYRVFVSATGSGCGSVVSGGANLVVNEKPSISSNPSSSSVCEGSNINFSTTATGGIAPLTYSWQYDNGVSWQNALNGTPTSSSYTGLGTNAITISGLTTTPYFTNYPYRVIVSSSGSGCDAAISSTANATINKIPGITNGTAAMCQGETKTLTTDIDPNVTWSSSPCPGCVSGNVFTAPNPGGASGTYNLTARNTNNSSCSNFIIQIVNASDPSNAGADQANCSSGTFTMAGNVPTFFPTSTGGWTCITGCAGVNIAAPTSNNTSVTGVGAGVTTTLRWRVINGSCISDDFVDLTNAIPSTAATGINASINGDICAGVNTVLTLTGGSLGTGATWQWYSASCGGTPEGSGTSVTKSPTLSTTYFVRAESAVCPPTSCQSIVVTAKPYNVSGTPILSATGSSTANGACLNSDGYIYYFLDPNATPGDADDRLMFAMNHNGNNLGTVNVTLDLTPGAGVFPPAQPSSPYCPSVSELHLGRVWDVTTGNQPVSPVNCRFYFLDTEFSTFAADAATENTSSGGTYGYCYGVPTVLSDLMMTVEHSSSLELFNPLSVAGGPQAGSQQVDFSLSEFSRGFLHSNGGIHGANPLPVTYLFIEANAVDNSFIRLNWATATEINNSGFEVQRSVDGVNWNAIGWVAGNNNSTTQINYNYSDYNVEPNTRYYYRLKQIDNDGDFEISTVVSAIISGTQTIGSVSVVPNPSNGMVQVRITSTVATEAKITLTDVLGRNVSESLYPLSKGLNTSNFDWSLVAEGTYTLTLTSANEVRSVKLIITK